MATMPQFLGPDGILRSNFIFTTTLARRFFTGTTDENTADMQVSLRGSAFTSDPDYIVFEGTSFTVPNPSVFPDGLQLLAGSNIVQVKAILTSGEVLATAQDTANLSLEQDLRGIAEAPSGVFLERSDSTVAITVEGLLDPTVQGYNFYASTQPGGGTVGYNKLNIYLVASGETTEDTNILAELSVDASIATNPDGTPAADPLYYVVQGSQQNSNDVVVQTDFNEALAVSETITRVRTSILVSSVRQVQRFTFTHDRLATFDATLNPAIPNATYNIIQPTDPLYYVVTAIYLIDNTEIESDFSPEVQGGPLSINISAGSFPAVSRQQILRNTTLAMFRSQPEIRFDPGSTTRDTFLDPFATEAERLRFIVDFLHNAQSFSTLLSIDDPALTGISIPVNQSTYKQALKQAFYLADNASVQILIDNAFDKLAGNLGVLRAGGRRSRGEVTFSLPNRPSTTQTFPIGQQVSGGSMTFRTTSFAQITSAGAGAAFNPATGRYSARAFIQANSPGNAGNLAPRQINTIVGGAAAGAQVTNESRTFGGLPTESNRDLAVKAMISLAGVDTGRYQGYVKTVTSVPGVLQVNVVDPGHPLMQRDIDPATGRHVGGTVDLWVRGESLATLTDSFAFSFKIAKSIQFEVIGSPTNLQFRAIDSALSTSNPIIEMLDYPSLGLQFVNTSTGQVYDLTNVSIIGYNAIQLDSTLNSAMGIAVTHVFSGSYRYRSSNKYVFTRQPVREITSLSGDPTRSGVISSTVYALYQGSDPLDLGRSTEAGDYIQITQPVSGSTVPIPSGDPIQVTDEQHVILSGIEYLGSLGINPLSVQVYSADRLTLYNGPFQSTTPDYTFLDENGTTPLGILTTSTTTIGDGSTLSVDYLHDENFVVTYTTNSLVAVTQEVIEDFRHLTADVLVKEAVQVPVDIYGTVVVQRGQDVGVVDSRVRTALARLFNTLVLGEPIRQSDVTGAMDAVLGVSYVVVPLTHLARGNGALVVRENLATDQDADALLVSAWSTSTVKVYLIYDQLSSATSDAGGAPNYSRGVYASETRLIHLETRPNTNGSPIKNKTGQAFIIGNLGLDIPGYSDDATLLATYTFSSDPDIQAQQLDDKRREVTADRVLVSLGPEQTPVDFNYAVTYIVTGDSGTKNIEPGPTEYLDVGNWQFTYDEDTDYQARVTGRMR